MRTGCVRLDSARHVIATMLLFAVPLSGAAYGVTSCWCNSTGSACSKVTAASGYCVDEQATSTQNMTFANPTGATTGYHGSKAAPGGTCNWYQGKTDPMTHLCVGQRPLISTPVNGTEVDTSQGTCGNPCQ